MITTGFYTEECRKGGNRIGFDIVYWPSATTKTQEPQRVALSRMMDRVQKGKPFVGKYLVDIDNVSEYAVASISGEPKPNELVVLDEIGKMEMLCPQFIPAVTRLLSNTSPEKRIVFGTLPTPRYGRVIADVENVRAREDVLVLHVTKDNRDELRELLSNILQKALVRTEDNCGELVKSLEPYQYTRPIGASSMNPDTGGKKKATQQASKKNLKADKRTNVVSTTGSTGTQVKPCGPLISPSNTSRTSRAPMR